MRFVLVICAALAIFAAGCRGWRRSEVPADEGIVSSEALALASSLRFSDIPAPRGFVYVRGESWTFEAAKGVRLAELHYRGSASLHDVVQFFEEQMPISGWRKEMSVGPEIKKRLLFRHSKKSERCKIVVETRGGYTYVVIEID
jgi:hypothetical protein